MGTPTEVQKRPILYIHRADLGGDRRRVVVIIKWVLKRNMGPVHLIYLQVGDVIFPDLCLPVPGGGERKKKVGIGGGAKDGGGSD